MKTVGRREQCVRLYVILSSLNLVIDRESEICTEILRAFRDKVVACILHCVASPTRWGTNVPLQTAQVYHLLPWGRMSSRDAPRSPSPLPDLLQRLLTCHGWIRRERARGCREWDGRCYCLGHML